MKLYKRVFTVLLVLTLIVSSFSFYSAYAATDYESALSQAQKEKEQLKKEIDAYNAKIANLKKQSATSQEYVDALNSKVALVQKEVDYYQNQVDELQKKIKNCESTISQTEQSILDTQKEIDDAKLEIETKKVAFSDKKQEYDKRLRAMYISGNVTNLEVLLTAKDMSQFLTRLEMVSSVSKSDSYALSALMSEMDDIKQEQEVLENKVTKLENSKVVLEESRKSLLVSKAELQPALDEVNAKKANLVSEQKVADSALVELHNKTNEYSEFLNNSKEELELNKKEEAEIQAAIKAEEEKRKQEEEASKKAEEEANKTTQSGGSSQTTTTTKPTTTKPSSSSGMIFPCAGYTYSKDFNRFPYYSNGSYHGGVDFSVPMRTPVRAVADGKVIIAKQLNYSYGHYIIIDHGNGLQTLYAHNSQLLVDVGDRVKQGQVISYSGSTGNSTGPHLHFELRKNGEKINPKGYLQ